MLRLKSQLGVTLVEVAVVLGIFGLIAGPSLFILRDFFAVPTRASIAVSLIQTANEASTIIAEDARNATAFAPGTAPDYGTFTWTDLTASTSASHSVRYFYSSVEKTLLREETIESGIPDTATIARHVEQQADVSIAETRGIINISVTTTVGASLSDPVNRTSVVQALLRPTKPTSQPTPPSYRVAWDDFETGTFAGGAGWTDDWFPTGDVSIDVTAAPFEGTFHMRLGLSPASVERAADLSGQADLRLQFQAKARNFQVGDTAELRISTDGGATFTTVRTWVDGQDDDTYRLEDIDLSPFPLNSGFLIAFVSNVSGLLGAVYIDDLKIIRAWSG